jgi:predicted DNA-binding transcriptional regulator YafY
MKSVKAIADEAGVNVQTVYRRLNKISNQSKEILTEKIDGITYFTETGERLIIESLTPDKQPIHSVKQAESAEILFLREQITNMNAEKVKLLDQIDKLTETIKIQAQSINAAHHNELAETVIDGRKLLSSPAPEKVSLWNKLFKRKSKDSND